MSTAAELHWRRRILSGHPGDMRRVLLAVFALIGVFLWAVMPLGPEPVIAQVEAAGCTNALTAYEDRTRPVLAVSARRCRAADGSLLGAEGALQVIVRSAWSASAPRFEDLAVTVYHSADDPQVLRATTRRFPRAEIEAALGPRPTDLDQGPPQTWRSDLPYAVLPLGALVIIAGVYLRLAALARAGVVTVVWFPPPGPGC